VKEVGEVREEGEVARVKEQEKPGGNRGAGLAIIHCFIMHRDENQRVGPMKANPVLSRNLRLACAYIH
jgi:hypothetical protein